MFGSITHLRKTMSIVQNIGWGIDSVIVYELFKEIKKSVPFKFYYFIVFLSFQAQSARVETTKR